MPKSSKQQSQRKAAERRRRRRSLVSHDRVTRDVPTDAVGDSAAGVDAPRLLVEAAMAVADRSGGLHDSALIGALRAIKNDSTSRSASTQAVQDEMLARLNAEGVGESQRRQAAAELLKIALENADPGSPSKLIRYFSLIAS